MQTINTETLITLPSLDIDPKLIKFKNISLQSDKIVVVRADDHIKIIDVNSENIATLKTAVDGVIINPTQNIIGLKAGGNLQVFDLTKRIKLCSATVQSSVEFWSWINSNYIALITPERVYHWNIRSKEEPKPIFDREPLHGRLQIISYKANHDLQWLLLGGISSAPDDSVYGRLQLYSVSRGRSQIFDGSHAGCFARMTGLNSKPPGEICDLFCFTHKINVTQTNMNSTDSSSTLNISCVEVAAEKTEAFRSTAPITLKGERDFAIGLQAVNPPGVLFVLSKAGRLLLTDIQSGATLVNLNTDGGTPFLCEPLLSNTIMGVASLGQYGVLKRFSIDKKTFIPNVLNTLRMNSNSTTFQRYRSVLIDMVIRSKGILLSENDMFNEEFEFSMTRQEYSRAAHIAAGSPNTFLRSKKTLTRFAHQTAPQNQPAPLLTYLGQLIRIGRLNEDESIALIEPLAISSESAKSSKNIDRIENWIRNDKLTASERLGDLLMNVDVRLACSVYLRTNHSDKTISCFVRLGKLDKIVPYARKQGVTLDYGRLLDKVIGEDNEKAKIFGQSLISNGSLTVSDTVDRFMAKNDFKTATSLLLDVLRLRGDRAEDADLQTRLLSININRAPQVAEAIFDSDEYSFTHYDRRRIAELCESARLFSIALEHYDDIEDILRVLRLGLRDDKIKISSAVRFFGELSPEDGLFCLRSLLKSSESESDKNMYVDFAMEVARTYTEQMKVTRLMELFRATNHTKLLFNFLGSVVNSSDDFNLVFEYVKAAAEIGEYGEIRRICKSNNVIDPEQIKTFLIDVDLADPRPLIALCDRYDYQDELARHLLYKDQLPFLEAYLQKVRPTAAPKAIGALLEAGATDEQISALLRSVPAESIGGELKSLASEFAMHDRSRILLPWLESAVRNGCKLAELHNAVGRVYVELNMSPMKFLETNPYYEPLELASLLEKRDPRLAFTALRKSTGAGDEALLRVACSGGLYAELAELLVQRQDEHLWESALLTEPEHRRALIARALPALDASRVPEEVAAAVRGFIAAQLPNELIGLLDQLLLRGSSGNRKDDAGSKNLQNLLLLTAIKADPQRVSSYLKQLNDYDGPDIAKIAEQYELYEEAFEIYVRFGLNDAAITVLLRKLNDFPRAKEFCSSAADQNLELWALLGAAELEKGLIHEAITSLCKGKCVKDYEKIVEAAEQNENWDDLVKYLKMAKDVLKNSSVDARLLYAYAKTNRLDDFKTFLRQNNIKKADEVGYRCMRENLYDAARALYENTANYGRLALCLVNLGSFEDAVAAAEKANTIQTWKVVCYACVDARQFSLAQFCAARVATHADQLNELISHYKQQGHFTELLAVLEQASSSERAHVGLFTALGEMYCQHRPNVLMGHLRLFGSKLNARELTKTALEYHCWAEAVYLYKQSGQYDAAAEVMMEHSPSCYNHDEMKSLVAKIISPTILNKIITFYIENDPFHLDDVLNGMVSKIDNTKIINQLKNHSILPLVRTYLQNVQKHNFSAANEALNDLYIEEERPSLIEKSIAEFDNFDAPALAERLENHRLKAFRSIAAHLYNKIGNFIKSLALLKQDDNFEQMIAAALTSHDRKRAEEVIRFFIAQRQPYFIAAALLDLGSLVRPHIILELGWRNGFQEIVMPFVVQSVNDFEERLIRLEQREKEREKIVSEKEEKKMLTKDGPLRIESAKSFRMANGINNLDLGLD